MSDNLTEYEKNIERKCALCNEKTKAYKKITILPFLYSKTKLYYTNVKIAITLLFCLHMQQYLLK
jgi:hypothetical protein